MDTLGNGGWILAGIGLLLGTWLVRNALDRESRRHNAADRRRMRRLAEEGVDLARPQAVRFLLFLRDEPTARRVAERLAGDGYHARFEAGKLERDIRRDSTGFMEDGYLVTAVTTLELLGNGLSERRLRFTALAEKENGVYLGWAPVEKNQDEGDDGNERESGGADTPGELE